MDAHRIEVIVQNAIQKYSTRRDSTETDASFSACEALTVESLWNTVYQEALAPMHELHPEKPWSAQIRSANSNLTIQLQDVPSLFHAALREARITSKIMAAVATRPIISIFDLEQEICEAEGVSSFDRLGLGRSIAVWPVVQQYFQWGQKDKASSPPFVFPVTSQCFLRFIACHPSSEAVRNGVGDVRDAMQAFLFYYEREMLPAVKPDEMIWISGSHRSVPSRVGNARMLGLCVKNFFELLTTLRAEATIREAEMKKACLGIVNEVMEGLPGFDAARSQLQANRSFYAKVVAALHYAAHAQPPPETSNVFSVQCSASDVEQLVLPSAWKQSFTANTPYEALSLSFRVGDHASAASTAALKPYPLGSKLSASQEEMVSKAKTAAPRRKRGARIVCEASETSPAEWSVMYEERLKSNRATEMALHDILPSSSKVQQTVSSETSGRDPASVGPSPLASSDNLKPSQTVLEELQAVIKAAGEGSVPIDHLGRLGRIVSLLSSLREGDEVEEALLWSTLDALSEGLLEASDDAPSLVRQHWWDDAFIPIIKSSTNPVKLRIQAMAPPSVLCWSLARRETLWEEDIWQEEDGVAVQSISTDLSALHDLCACGVLKDAYPPRFRSFFIHVIGVSPYPSVRSWIWFVQHGRRASPSTISTQYLALLKHCVYDDLCERLLQKCAAAAGSSKDGLRKIAVDALAELLRDIPPETSVAHYLFPAGHSWYRGVDEVYACGPRYVGCSGVYFKPSSSLTESPPLRCLELDEACSHFAVELVLQRCGIRSISRFITPVVSLTHPSPRNGYEDEFSLAKGLHVRLATIVPCIQQFYRQHYPLLYALSYSVVSRRLQSIRVVLGYHLRVTEQLKARSGSLYSFEQSPRLCYVASENTIYGVAEHFSSPVVANVLCEVFLPLSSTPVVRSHFTRTLQEAWSIVSDSQGDCLPDVDLERAAQALKAQLESLPPRRTMEVFLFSSFVSSMFGEGEEERVWEVSVPPSRVCRWTFPPSATDKLSCASTHPLVSMIRPAAAASPTQEKALYGALPRQSEWSWGEETAGVCRDPHDVLSELLSLAETSPTPPPAMTTAPTAPPKPPHYSGLKRYRDAHEDEVSTELPRAPVVSNEPARIREYAKEAEKYVWKTLSSRFANEKDIEVVWVNMAAEMGEPYDIVVCRLPQSSGQQRRILFFVEVKSTCSSNRHDFELSLSELVFATRYGSAYQVYRVYGASTNALKGMRVVEYKDVVQQWRRSQLTLTGDIHCVPSAAALNRNA